MVTQPEFIATKQFLENCFVDSNFCLEEFRRMIKVQTGLLDCQRAVLGEAILKHQRIETLVLHMLCNLPMETDWGFDAMDGLHMGLGMLSHLTTDAENFCGTIYAIFFHNEQRLL